MTAAAIKYMLHTYTLCLVTRYVLPSTADMPQFSPSCITNPLLISFLASGFRVSYVP